MKEKLKDKKIIAGLVIGVVAVIGIIVFVVLNMNNSVLKLKSKEVVVEYGEIISLDAKDYLKDDVDSKIINETKTTIKEDVAITDNKEYLGVGEYTLVLTYKKDTAEVKVIVKDTTAPAFKDFKDSIETAKDVKLDYTTLYSIEDLSKSTISCEDKEVKYDTVGSYKAIIKAIDQYENEVKKEITVNVIEPTIKIDKESVSLYVKETIVLKATIVGKEQKATYKSSNEKIVSVDQDGKISAKISGSATITVSANGKDAICKVTVKETPKGSSIETKKDSNGNTVTIVKPSNPGNNEANLTAQINKDAINLINKERSKIGKSALVYDSSLGDIALKRAKELEANFSHEGLNKYDPTHRLGECIAKMNSSNNASSVVSGWMNSTGHRKILMDEYDLGDTKIAVAQYGKYWVAITSK